MKSMKTRILTLAITILLIITTWSQTKTFGTKVKIQNIPETTTVDTLVVASPTGILQSLKYTTIFGKLLADLQANGSLGGGGGSINSIGDVNDVTLTNPLGNQALMYNGTNWVNSAISIPSTQISDFNTAVQALSTDNQTLSVSGNDLTISSGNTVSIPSSSDVNFLKEMLPNYKVPPDSKLYGLASDGTSNYWLNLNAVTTSIVSQPNLNYSNVQSALNELGIRTNKTVTTKTANYTFAISDAFGIYEFDSNTDITATLPANVVTSFDVGTVIYIIKKGSGNVIINGSIYKGIGFENPKIKDKYGVVKAVKVSIFNWVISGDVHYDKHISTTTTNIDVTNEKCVVYTTPQTATSFNISNSETGGCAQVIIDSSGMASYPTITGATLIASPDFVAGTHRMTVFNEAGTIKYFFTKE